MAAPVMLDRHESNSNNSNIGLLNIYAAKIPLWGAGATDMVGKMRPDIDPATRIAPEEIADIVMFLLTHRNNAVIDEIGVHRAANAPWK